MAFGLASGRACAYLGCRAEGRMTAGPWSRGKSGLPEARVPGNARRGQPQGKRHREETAPARRGDGEKVGQEPTAGLATGPARQAPPGAMPNRGLARKGPGHQPQGCRRPPQGRFSPRGPGWQLDRRGNADGRGMVIQGAQAPGQNPAYRPSAQLSLGRRDTIERGLPAGPRSGHRPGADPRQGLLASAMKSEKSSPCELIRSFW